MNTPTATVLFSLLVVCLQATPAHCFGSFQLPKVELPNPFGGGPLSPASSSSSTAISIGEKVLVVGGTGGVGQLVTRKLRSRGYDVRVASRDVNRATETIGDDGCEVVRLNLVGEEKSSDDEMRAAFEGIHAVVISVGTTAFPTKKWQGGNTPKAIDNEAVTRLADAAAAVESVKRLALLTSVGTSAERKGEMPFPILNLFGVLDAKRAGEEAVMRNGDSGAYDYSIVRPGRLVGGPYTNLDLAKLMQIEGGAENGLTVEVGDTLLGDCKRDACAEAVVQCLERAECKNAAFSIVSNEDAALTDEQWSDAFLSMRGE